MYRGLWCLDAIIWNNVGLLWTGPLGTDFSKILIKIQQFSSKENNLKMPLQTGLYSVCVDVLTFGKAALMAIFLS